MRAGSVIGAEALIRWQHPERGLLLNPDEFLPVVEYVGLNVELGRWVLDTAFAQAQAWQDAGLALSININIAVDQLQHPDLVKDLAALIERYPRIAPPASNSKSSKPPPSGTFPRFRATQGCPGRWASGLRWTTSAPAIRRSPTSSRYPSTPLKIDQVFVRDMLDDPKTLPSSKA